MMSIINSIGDVCYTLFFILLLIMAAVVFYDYLKERTRIKEEVPEADSCSDEEQDELSEYADCMCEVTSINVSIFESSVRLRKLNNPDLKYALEELNLASDHVCEALRHIHGMNYPIDELENENETRES